MGASLTRCKSNIIKENPDWDILTKKAEHMCGEDDLLESARTVLHM